MVLAFWAASEAGLEGLLRALVAAVGEDHEDFAAGLDLKLVVSGEVDGVVEQGAAGIAGGHGAAANSRNSSRGAGGVDGGLVDGAGELAGTAGVVGEKVYVDVEGDEEGLVLGGEDLFEEARAGLLLEGKDVLLAAAGIEQNADGEGEIFLLGEVFDGLRIVVLVDLAVFLAEAGDVAVLVADGEIGVDEVDVELEGLVGVADVLLLGGSFAGRGRGVRGGGLLGADRGDGGKQESERERRKAAH